MQKNVFFFITVFRDKNDFFLKFLKNLLSNLLSNSAIFYSRPVTNGLRALKSSYQKTHWLVTRIKRISRSVRVDTRSRDVRSASIN